jgi:Mannosyltransferase (PIG-V)
VSVRKSVRVLDTLTLLCAAAAAGLAMFGAFREYVMGAVVSVEWTHALFVTVGLAAVRHALVPSPSIFTALRSWRHGLVRRPALRDAMLAFWLTRPTVLLVGVLAVTAIGAAPKSQDAIGRDPLATLPARFDAGWYAGIAYDGYEWQHRFDRQQNLAFFPAFPLAMRALGAIVGDGGATTREQHVLRYIWIGLFISLAAFFCGVWYFSRIAREMLGDERATAAALLLAAYPFAIFYSAAYTESLILLAAVGAWHHFRHAQWTAAAAWGLVAGLSRPNGFFLSVPLGLLALGVRDGGQENARAGRTASGRVMALAVAAMPTVGMLIFTVYVYQLTEIWFAWARMHEAWGRSFGSEDLRLAPVGSAAGLLQLAAAHPFQALNAAGLGFALALVWPVWRTLGPAWTVFVLINVLLPLAAGGVLSMGRLTSTLFPLFLSLAAVISSRATTAWVALFAIVQGLAAVLFFTWRELF